MCTFRAFAHYCLRKDNILGTTLKNNPAFLFASHWCCSDYMQTFSTFVGTGKSTSEAAMLTELCIMVEEANNPGAVARIVGRSFSSTDDFEWVPPTDLRGVLYDSCSGMTSVVLSDKDCEVWVYATCWKLPPVAVLRNSHLDILDYGRWGSVNLEKRQELCNHAVTTSYPSEWYDLEAEFDGEILRDRKKRSKERSYPDELQDRFRHCIPARKVEGPKFDSLKEYLDWVFGECFFGDVKKHYATQGRKALTRSRKAKAKMLSIKRRSTRRAIAALR